MAAICSHVRHLWRPPNVLSGMLTNSHGGSLWPAQEPCLHLILLPRS
jgi:hypothetical protein